MIPELCNSEVSILLAPQLDSREDNKMWLVRHLELIRQITLKDLRIAKSLCQPVFPPHYNILEHFLQLYHEALSNRVRK